MKTIEEARAVLKSETCPICESILLVLFLRPPIDIWKVHCNKCGSEFLLDTFIKRKAKSL